MTMTRRRFAQLSLATCAAPTWAAVRTDTRAHIIDMANAPFFDRDQVPRDLDGANACTRPNHDFLDGLVNSGVDTVLRYYSDTNNANLNCKNVTTRERDLLHDHGLALAIVYQHEGRAKNRYTGARAVQDAQFCLDRARKIRQPQGSTIYFGVDSDAALNTDQGVIDYFTQINRAFQGRFQVGIYAAGARCELIRRRDLADAFWVPEAPAWAGTRAFMNSGQWSVFQNKTNINNSRTTADLGQPLHIDTDIMNPAAGTTLGGFTRDGSIKHYDRARLNAVAAARHWVTASQLDVFEDPGGRKTSHICIARTVHVLEMGTDWAWVDLDEDGIGDGYVRTTDLAPLKNMPKWRRSGCKLPDI
ncbi:MAG: glycoside hydrolase domain-containing protein [Sedimentitalea sp.]